VPTIVAQSCTRATVKTQLLRECGVRAGDNLFSGPACRGPAIRWIGKPVGRDRSCRWILMRSHSFGLGIRPRLVEIAVPQPDGMRVWKETGMPEIHTPIRETLATPCNRVPHRINQLALPEQLTRVGPHHLSWKKR